MNLRSALPLGALLIATPALAACGSSDSNSTPTPVSKATITASTAKGCVIDHTTFAAGVITFDVSNVDATAVSEIEVMDDKRIYGEKENLPPGFTGSFSITAPAGTYTVFCPGATPNKATISVVGDYTANASRAELATQASKGWANYVTNQVGLLLTAVENLNTALHGTDLAAAQKAYADARAYYERIEPVAESFPELDPAIDARADGVSPLSITGFHRIEYGLFSVKSLEGLGTFGTGLVENVKKLQTRTQELAAKPMPYELTELANGAQGLLDEVAASKITGEEERYSHIDMLDFASNNEGAQEAFEQLVPILQQVDPAITTLIQQRFDALNKLVATYRDSAEPSGYKLYNALTPEDIRQLAAAVKAVQEPLSQVASKVAG